MNTKRGLSDVVTTVLIILIALGALGIVAGFFLPMIKQGSSQITGACLQIDIEPVKCVITETSEEDTTLDVYVKRNTGDAQLKKVNMVFELDDETTTVSTAEENLPAILETKILNAANVSAVGIKSVKIAPVVLSESGKEMSCPETAAVECK